MLVGLQVGCLDALLKDLMTMNKTHHFTADRAAQLLATQSRRADLAGPVLQNIHVKMGRYVMLLRETCSTF